MKDVKFWIGVAAIFVLWGSLLLGFCIVCSAIAAFYGYPSGPDSAEPIQAPPAMINDEEATAGFACDNTGNDYVGTNRDRDGHPDASSARMTNEEGRK